MRSENKNETLRMNRFLANPIMCAAMIVMIDIAAFLLFTYVLNVVIKFPDILNSVQSHGNIDLGLSNMKPRIFSSGKAVLIAYAVFLFVMIIVDVRTAYRVRASYSEKNINKGQAGTSRWTTVSEIKKQYKKIPLKDKSYPGQGGTIISRVKDNLYVDDSLSNTLVTGTTRSGKGEMYVFPTIDVYSRARELKDRPSMIINDPKLELYRSCKRLLESRGYIVRLFNIDDPIHSMGYNPLQLVIDYYKAGMMERAQMAAKTFAFSIFHADDNMQEPIWKNTATDLFTALIVAVTTDCLEADKVENETRQMMFAEKREAFDLLDEDDKEEAIKRYDYIASMGGDQVKSPEVKYIPEYGTCEETNENEKKINCFSVINFFKDMVDRAANLSADEESFGKMAETALDDYFNRRPKLDYAASLYNEIKSAGDRTKGSVYINMQSAVSTFALDNIARMTAENNIAIEDLGYGERPVAVFMGIPSEDRLNHFLATTFIAQVYQYLFRLTKNTGGKLDRRLKFILDEFGNLPPIENFAGFVTVCLGLGISFDIYVQSYNQIPAKYGDEAQTILENFANQIYIKSVGNESAQEFSEMLRNRTVIEVQRSGSLTSLDKSYMESAKERPLLYPDELARFKEGECAIYRGIKRSDRLGRAVEPFPIINEYNMELGFFIWLKIAAGFVLGRDKERYLYHPTEKRQTSKREEWLMRVNFAHMYYGTALLFRWQYLKGTFPDPDTVDLAAVCDEDRSHIDFAKRVYDPDEVIEKMKSASVSTDAFAGAALFGEASAAKKAEPQEEAVFSGEDRTKITKVSHVLKEIVGEDYEEKMGLSDDSNVSSYIECIEKTNLLSEPVKNMLLGILRKGGAEGE